jgi:hypothetical protein
MFVGTAAGEEPLANKDLARKPRNQKVAKPRVGDDALRSVRLLRERFKVTGQDDDPSWSDMKPLD